MVEPLSVLCSIGGLITIGASIVTVLTTTISKTRSAPASIQSLSKELKALCTALSNLDSVFKLHDVLHNPLFPVDILSELLDNIMADFIAVQKGVSSYTAKQQAGPLKQVWMQFCWSFRENDVRELRDNIAAYKATIIMTISAANFATTCSSTLRNSVEFSTLHASISELRGNLLLCTPVNQRLRSGSIGTLSRSGSGARPQDGRSYSPLSAISQFSLQRTPPQINAQDSAASGDGRSTTILESLPGVKSFLTRSSSVSSSYTYGAKSILDLYCASVSTIRQESTRQLKPARGPEVEQGPELQKDLTFFMRVSELDKLSHSIYGDGGLVALLREVCRVKGWLSGEGMGIVEFRLWLLGQYIAAGDATHDTRDKYPGFMGKTWTEAMLSGLIERVTPHLGAVIWNTESLNSLLSVSSLL